jgi:hypothetical protein
MRRIIEKTVARRGTDTRREKWNKNCVDQARRQNVRAADNKKGDG